MSKSTKPFIYLDFTKQAEYYLGLLEDIDDAITVDYRDIIDKLNKTSNISKMTFSERRIATSLKRFQKWYYPGIKFNIKLGLIIAINSMDLNTIQCHTMKRLIQEFKDLDRDKQEQLLDFAFQ